VTPTALEYDYKNSVVVYAATCRPPQGEVKLRSDHLDRPFETTKDGTQPKGRRSDRDAR